MTQPSRRPMTLTQKILAQHAQGLERPWVQAGDILNIKVDWTIASELAWNGMERTWDLLGKPQVADQNRFFLAVDHTVDEVTLKNDARTQKLVQLSRDFAKSRRHSPLLRRQPDHPAHQVLPGPGAARPGGAGRRLAHLSPRRHGRLRHRPGRRRHHRRHGARPVVDRGARGHRRRLPGHAGVRHRRQGHHPAHARRAGPQHRRHGALRRVPRRRTSSTGRPTCASPSPT